MWKKFATEDVHRNLENDSDCRIMWAVKDIVYLGTLRLSIHTLHNSFPISVVFGITHLRIVLLNIYTICKDQKREGRTFLKGINQLFLRVNFKNVGQFSAKNSLV